MIRLALTIIFVLFLAIQIAVAIWDRVEMAMYYRDGEPFFAGQYLGTFELLDEAISESTEASLPTDLAELNSRFKTALRLEYKHDLDLPDTGLSILDNRDIYLHDLGTSSYLYKTSIFADRVWSLAISRSASDERIASVDVTLSMIKGKLAGNSINRRVEIVDELQNLYDVPLFLKKVSEISLGDKEESLLESSQIVVVDPFQSGEIFFTKIDGSEYAIQFGPIEYPASFENKNWLYGIAFAAIAITCILFWMWPLWRDLQRLRVASLDIGSGRLDARVRSNRVSLIKPVLDSFNQMATRTENMVDSQRYLTNAVSHELRTPIARMFFDLQMAKDSFNQVEQSRHFDNLEHNVGELNTLVDELLTYASCERMESPLDLDTVTLDTASDWLNSQISRVQPQVERNCKISVSFDIESIDEKSIQFNPRLMAHALSNSLQNAIRFANQTIEIEFRKHNTDWLISVEDDGIGIPEDKREQVFQPFFRLDESRNKASGGFGLGFSIVRKIAQWHQGDACIAPSQSLTGTRVEIRWPIDAAFE